jgi:hypothetical protein
MRQTIPIQNQSKANLCPQKLFSKKNEIKDISSGLIKVSPQER